MLSLSNVSHVYANGTRALDGVNLDVPKGMFGLLGPNGAGKSTLMRSIATLQTPSSGQIRFGDIDILREPEKLRATLGYLPQDFGVYPRVSAYDLLDHLLVIQSTVLDAYPGLQAFVEAMRADTRIAAYRTHQRPSEVAALRTVLETGQPL